MRLRYAFRRAIQVLPLIFGVVVVNFVLIHLTPGDPASALAGEQAPQEYVDRLRAEYGLDRSIFEQLLLYFQKMLVGDLGYSFAFQRPVLDVVAERIGPTLLLVLSAEIPAIVLGTALGAYAARHFGKWVDRLVNVIGLTLYSIPVFWSGLVFILVLSLQLGWFPTSGFSGYGVTSGLESVLDVARHLFLPALTLFLFLLPAYLRLSRAAVLEVMREDYVITARAIGYSENSVFFRHALRNSLLPTISTAGISLGLTLSGALLVETVFAWPGMGQLMYNAVFQRDYPLLMGVFLLSAVFVAIFSVIADFLSAVVDPRVAYD